MEIRTERLLLRDLTEDDWPAVLAYQGDPAYWRHRVADGTTPEEARDFVRRLVGLNREEPRTKWVFAITLADTGELIGICSARRPDAESTYAETGYELGPAFWGRGYATEAARAMLRFAFAELGVHRVQASCGTSNEPSERVMKRLGMRREGVLREHGWVKGRWEDELVYGILAHEWEAREGK
jgi:[ribosomal protein S5]-alanine N-acetyltransferase